MLVRVRCCRLEQLPTKITCKISLANFWQPNQIAKWQHCANLTFSITISHQIFLNFWDNWSWFLWNWSCLWRLLDRSLWCWRAQCSVQELLLGPEICKQTAELNVNKIGTYSKLTDPKSWCDRGPNPQWCLHLRLKLYFRCAGLHY